jgi:hypothetical protein
MGLKDADEGSLELARVYTLDQGSVVNATGGWVDGDAVEQCTPLSLARSQGSVAWPAGWAWTGDTSFALRGKLTPTG